MKPRFSPVRALPVLLLCLLCLLPTAYADIGPKPEVTITVVNAPEGTLYIDLLAQGQPTGQSWFSEDEEAGCDPAVLSSLRSLETEGWVLAYSTGRAGSAPVFGDVRPQEDGTWHFTYVGLPETFRVAAATAEEAKAVEQPYTRQFTSHIVYDWQANTVREATPSALRFLARLAATLIPTLILEGIIFFLFGFREGRSWLVFLLVNAVTQVGLHLAVGPAIATAGWYFLSYFGLLLLPELVIWAVEAVVYAVFLREHDRYQQIGCALLANAVSFAAGFFPLHQLYGFLRGL